MTFCLSKFTNLSSQHFNFNSNFHRHIKLFSKKFIHSFKGKKFKLMDLSTSKRVCTGITTNNKVEPKIGTHDGVFHCDEILACFILKKLPHYYNAAIIRTRDETKLAECDVVVDVGGVYDPAIHRYDHHQRSFQETFSSLVPNKPWTTRLSSAGLVYVHFGRNVIAHLLNIESNDDLIDAVYDKVYENFIQEIDGIDNGIGICEGEQKYRITTHLSARIGNLNPSWNEPSNDALILQRFERAMQLAGEEFQDKVFYYAHSWWPAKQIVQNAIKSRFDIDESGEIVELSDRGGVPWKEHLFQLEKEHSIYPSIKYVIFADSKGNWRVQGVPLEPHSFELRVPLHKDWQGLRDDELSAKSQIADCIFVHQTGFIGGNKQRLGAIQMAKKSLELSCLQNNVVASSDS